MTAIWLVAFGARVLYVWQISDAPFFDVRLGDAEAYHAWARQIADGDWFGGAVFYQAPLYPYLLAILYRTLGDSVLVVRLAHAALGAFSCTFFAAAGLSLFPRFGIIAGAGLALYGPAIFLDGLLEKSALSTFLITALLALLLLVAGNDRPAPRRWLAAGLVLGLLSLTRENALLLGVPIVCWILLGALTRTRRTTAVLLFAAGCAIVLVPVGLRNLSAGGAFHLTTSQFGPNFYIGNHDGASGTYDPLVLGHGSARDERDDATRLAEAASGRRLNPGEVSSYWTGRALEYIASQPIDWLRLLARKFALTFNAAEVSDTESLDVYAERSWLLRLLKPFNFGVLFALSVFGTLVTWPRRRELWILYALAGTYALSVVLFYVFARYRFPLVPILMILAAGGVAEFGRRPARHTIAAAAAAALAFACTMLPLENGRAAVAAHYASLGAALSRDSTLRYGENAEAFYRHALDEAPDFPAAEFGLATHLARTGRHAEAITHFRAALRSWPAHFESHHNLGVSLAHLGRLQDAADEYREASRLRPDDLDARLGLAKTFVAQQRPDLAIAEYEHALTIDPRNVSALVGLGVALAQSDRPDEATAMLQRALTLDPANAAAHNSLGWLLAMQGRLNEAIPHFERAVELDPTDAAARTNLQRAKGIGK